MAPKPLELYTKNVSYHLRHPLEKFETEPKTFDKIWHGFCREVGRGTSPYLGHICHGDSHIRDSPRCQEEAYAGFLPRFARLRSRRAVEHTQKNTSTCSTRSKRARARPRPTPRAPLRTKPCPYSSPHTRPRAYKASSGVDHTPPRTLDLTGARNHRRLPCRQRARGHPIPRHRRPASRALPSHARPSEETVHAS
jgi:hypothetical protein